MADQASTVLREASQRPTGIAQKWLRREGDLCVAADVPHSEVCAGWVRWSSACHSTGASVRLWRCPASLAQSLRAPCRQDLRQRAANPWDAGNSADVRDGQDQHCSPPGDGANSRRNEQLVSADPVTKAKGDNHNDGGPDEGDDQLLTDAVRPHLHVAPRERLHDHPTQEQRELHGC